MDKNKVVGEIKKSVTYNEIENIVVGAFEGGCYYWMALDNKGRKEWEEKPKGEPISTWATKLLVDGVTIHLYDREDEEEKWELTLEKLINGISTNSVKRPFDSDLENADADTYDCIMQYALFGEIVYG